MSDPRHLKFLARGPYRQRRLRDLARILPVMGAVLTSLPLLWQAGALTSQGILYIFGVWSLLIVAAGLISRFVADPTDPEAK